MEVLHGAKKESDEQKGYNDPVHTSPVLQIESLYYITLR